MWDWALTAEDGWGCGRCSLPDDTCSTLTCRGSHVEGDLFVIYSSGYLKGDADQQIFLEISHHLTK